MVKYVLIEEFPGYRVGDDGSVWSSRVFVRGGGEGPWHVLKAQIRRGYMRAGLWKDGKLYWMSVHRLVLSCFQGPCPCGMVTCHRNGKKFDNRNTNLRWGTPASNCLDKRAHGTMSHGSKHPDAKLSEADIPEIRRRIELGESRRSIARLKGVSHTVINGIARGESWVHV